MGAGPPGAPHGRAGRPSLGKSGRAASGHSEPDGRCSFASRAGSRRRLGASALVPGTGAGYHHETGQGPICQFLPADPIDKRVVEAFFQALSRAELDLYDQIVQGRKEQEREAAAAQEREFQRLRYDVTLARRQYDRVDPDNRLVAAGWNGDGKTSCARSNGSNAIVRSTTRPSPSR